MLNHNLFALSKDHSSGNCSAPLGMMIPGSLRLTQTWIALETSMGWSSEPALIESISDSDSD